MKIYPGIALALVFAGQTYLLGVTHGKHSRQAEIDQILASQDELIESDRKLKAACDREQKATEGCVASLDRATRAMNLAGKQLDADRRMMKVCREYAENHP